MKKDHEEWTPGTATPDEVAAIRGYTSATYKTTNRMLRGHILTQIDKMSKETGRVVRCLDAVDNAIFTGDIYRGVSSKTRDRLAKAGALVPGAIIEDRGFKSFSASSDFAKGWKSGLLIKARGTRGCADIKSMSTLPEEEEVLVSRKMKMKVLKWSPETGVLEVELFMEDDMDRPAAKRNKRPEAVRV